MTHCNSSASVSGQHFWVLRVDERTSSLVTIIAVRSAACDMFKVVGFNRPETDYRVIKTPETVVSSPNKCSVLGNWGRLALWRCQNFDRKLESSSFCASTVQTWPKQPTTTIATSGSLQFALLCNCHLAR